MRMRNQERKRLAYENENMESEDVFGWQMRYMLNKQLEAQQQLDEMVKVRELKLMRTEEKFLQTY